MCVNLVAKLPREFEEMTLDVRRFDSLVLGRRLGVFGFALAECVWYLFDISVVSHI